MKQIVFALFTAVAAPVMVAAQTPAAPSQIRLAAIEQPIRALNLGAVEVWSPTGERVR